MDPTAHTAMLDMLQSTLEVMDVRGQKCVMWMADSDIGDYHIMQGIKRLKLTAIEGRLEAPGRVGFPLDQLDSLNNTLERATRHKALVRDEGGSEQKTVVYKLEEEGTNVKLTEKVV